MGKEFVLIKTHLSISSLFLHCLLSTLLRKKKRRGGFAKVLSFAIPLHHFYLVIILSFNTNRYTVGVPGGSGHPLRGYSEF